MTTNSSTSSSNPPNSAGSRPGAGDPAPDAPTAALATTGDVSRGSLARRAERRAYLERVVPGPVIAQLEEAHQTFFGALTGTDMTPTEKTLLTSSAVVSLRKMLGGEILKNVIMPLMNSPVGFDTDKNPMKGWNGPSYSPQEVLECAAEAWLHGLPMTGNAWNIIGSRMYPRKEGFELLLSSVCRFSAKVSVPEIGKQLYEQGGYLRVPVEVQYKFHGEPDEAPNRRFHGTYSVRLNRKNAVGVENVEGKAKRKAYRDLWLAVTGTLLPDADDPDEAGTVHQVGAHFGPAPTADEILHTAGKAGGASGSDTGRSEEDAGPVEDYDDGYGSSGDEEDASEDAGEAGGGNSTAGEGGGLFR